MYTTIDAEQAKALLASENVRILDLRDFRSYRGGHIAGAVMLHDGLEQQLIDEAERDEPLLLYCYRGIKSKEKAEYLAHRGFTRVYTLENGYTGWPRDDDSGA